MADIKATAYRIVSHIRVNGVAYDVKRKYIYRSEEWANWGAWHSKVMRMPLTERDKEKIIDFLDTWDGMDFYRLHCMLNNMWHEKWEWERY